MKDTPKQPPKVTDIIVKVNNPAALDNTLKPLGALVVQSDIDIPIYMQKDGGYVVRCFADVDFIEFCIKSQGYGTVLKRLDTLV